MRSNSNTTHEDNDKFNIYKNSAVVSIIIFLLLLMTGCSSILADEKVMESRKELEIEEVKTQWKVLSSDNYWNGSTFTVGRDELVVRNPMEDRGGVVTTILSLKDSKTIGGLRETEEVLYYEVYFAEAERGMYADDITRLQKGGFDTYETEEELILSTENPEVVAKFSHVSETPLHLYESEEILEVVSVNHQYPAIFQAIPHDTSQEDIGHPQVMELYSQLHEDLSEKSHKSMVSARASMDELENILPNSKITPMFRELIDNSEAYLNAVYRADEEEMTDHLNQLAKMPYSNLYGLLDEYTVLYDTLIPHLGAIKHVDKQMEVIATLMRDEHYEKAEMKLTKLHEYHDILTIYYPEKAKRLKLLKTQFKDSQKLINRNDFNGYWGMLDNNALSDLEKDILYISDDYYFISQSSTNLLALTQIESAMLEDSILHLNVFEKKYHLKQADTRASLKIQMIKDKEGKRLVLSMDGEENTFYPVPAEEAISETGIDVEARGNKLYQ